MLNSYYIISELNSKIKINLKKNSNINVIFRSEQKDYNNDTLKKIIKINIYNKVFVANKNNICHIKGLSGIYLSAFNKKILTSNHFTKKSIIGSAHSFKEIREKIKSKCSIIFLSPIFKTKTDKLVTPLGMIKFLLISKHFRTTTLIPLGGIQEPFRLKNYGIKGFAGVSYFNKSNNLKY
jgi:thiamine-phosphate pyrophosphorylase